MATLSQPVTVGGVETASRNRTGAFPADSLRFDYVYAILTGLFTIGLFLDGWAHNHGKVDDSFFTPWHAVLYGSVLLIGLLLVGTHFTHLRQGYPVLKALPEGYTVSLFGVILFFGGGGLDFGWHSIFGFEAKLETLLSPAHLLLATAAFLFVTGPLRAAWHRAEGKGWVALLPAIVSLTVVLSLLTFFTQFAHFLGNPQLITGPRTPSDSFFADLSGVVSVLLASAITMGIFLLAIRRWVLPFGAFTFMLTANFALMCWMRYTPDNYMPWLVGAGFVAGLIADGLFAWLKPSAERPIALRLFAFLVPGILSLLYFFVLISMAGTWWRVHMWLGTIFYAAIAGLLLSYLIVPPAIPVRQHSA